VYKRCDVGPDLSAGIPYKALWYPEMGAGIDIRTTPKATKVESMPSVAAPYMTVHKSTEILECASSLRAVHRFEEVLA
jgi:hypothetical protein